MNMKMRTHTVGQLMLGLAVLVPAVATGWGAGEKFTATASVKSPSSTATAPVTISIDRFVSDAERDKLAVAVKANDHAATRRALEAAEDIGYIEVGSRRTPIKYAYARPVGGGRMITVVTAKPIVYLGSGVPGAKPTGQHELALALLVLDGQGKGDGEFSPAVTVKVDDKGAIVTTDYSREVVRLTAVSQVK